MHLVGFIIKKFVTMHCRSHECKIHLGLFDPEDERTTIPQYIWELHTQHHSIT
jgi:hypothetical protein